MHVQKINAYTHDGTPTLTRKNMNRYKQIHTHTHTHTHTIRTVRTVQVLSKFNLGRFEIFVQCFLDTWHAHTAPYRDENNEKKI